MANRRLNMIIDLHIHSKYSFDSIQSPSKIIKIAKKNLDGIAITDHGTIKGGLEAKKINKDPNLIVIVGCEINTEIGDIIGLFLNKEINSRNSMEVIREIKAQDGIVVLPHPYRGHKLNEELLNSVDAIEGFNARSTIEENEKGMELAKKYNKPIVAGSDAHFTSEIGNAKCCINEEIGDLKLALLSHKKIYCNPSPQHYKEISQIIKSFKMRKIKKFRFKSYI